jgi:hypothetical protein
MVYLDVGHFLHLEAPDQLTAHLKELFAVPLLPGREFKYSPAVGRAAADATAP